MVGTGRRGIRIEGRNSFDDRRCLDVVETLHRATNWRCCKYSYVPLPPHSNSRSQFRFEIGAGSYSSRHRRKRFVRPFGRQIRHVPFTLPEQPINLQRPGQSKRVRFGLFPGTHQLETRSNNCLEKTGRRLFYIKGSISESIQLVVDDCLAIGREQHMESVFQELVFLIRDWNQSPDEPHGICSVDRLIPKTRGHNQYVPTFEHIQRVFTNATGFRLPHPGVDHSHRHSCK